ncbi:hypothetical protein [Cytobacillus sp.]|uniref:hypothetical protein n=1 Tax=Cytobacillus sp. TaxID=2675269 RepID=UPI0035154B17
MPIIISAVASAIMMRGQPPQDGGNRGDMFSNLDEETRAKAQEIMEKERAGTITREEAQTQLAELGVELPGGGEGGQPPQEGDNMFSNLDEETRTKAQEIMEKERSGTITREEAQAQLTELGIEFPGGNRPE